MTKAFDVRAWWDPASGRVLSDADLRPDPALLAEGWERRFTADASRAAEAMELYAQLGYEVRAESIHHQEQNEACESNCFSLALEFKTIYTRKRQARPLTTGPLALQLKNIYTRKKKTQSIGPLTTDLLAGNEPTPS